ncbi:hypothetical protein HC248_02547 [Polaromonas vacuolata]|uniref:DUF4019 domain-containing protein n=1 Tax=Polaromonas vacuolata TaxID=37448 RepID=A0A6H2HCN3_9BURK|nr:DUF4019 domain-containing protein [Polaromonas vacuolata]QJC57226.1 hypothetical protein HC248_02547 [Polaromonas vacuolata]
MRKSKYVKWTNSLVLRLWLLLVACGLSFGVFAQTSSADSAISIAQQWLEAADADAAIMWEKSDPLMKDKVDRTFWINYIMSRKNTLGSAPGLRVWTEMERKINHPSLPPGEFTSVLFVSQIAQIRTWEKVSLVWNRDHWSPVGYQYGTIPNINPIAK